MKNFKILILILSLVFLSNCLTIEQAKMNPFQAYVLTDNSGKVVGDSGIRIGPLDLKYLTPETVKKLGLNDDLVELLTPYLGVHGEEGLTLIRSKPFRLTRDQYETLESRMKSYYQQVYDSLPPSEKKDPVIEKLNALSKEGNWPEFFNLATKFFEADRIMIRGNLVTAVPLNIE